MVLEADNISLNHCLSFLCLVRYCDVNDVLKELSVEGKHFICLECQFDWLNISHCVSRYNLFDFFRSYRGWCLNFLEADSLEVFLHIRVGVCAKCR